MGNNEQEMSYGLMVSKLAKPGKEIRDSLTPADCHIQHMSIGICTESGELLDAIKKVTIYRKVLDMENVVEELGDLEFYIEGLRQELGISRDEVLKRNMEKLLTGKKARYKEGNYSNESAQRRSDKEMGETNQEDPEILLASRAHALLDERSEDQLMNELNERFMKRRRGVCDYCGRPPDTKSCRFPARHNDSRTISTWKELQRRQLEKEEHANPTKADNRSDTGTT